LTIATMSPVSFVIPNIETTTLNIPLPTPVSAKPLFAGKDIVT